MGAPTLRGRRSECQALEGLLDAARAGASSVLVLRGEAGAGKAALLDFVAEHASGFRVAHVLGVSEMELAFAGVHQLCAPMLDRVEHCRHPNATGFSPRRNAQPATTNWACAAGR
jgi:AAA ATPase domain